MLAIQALLLSCFGLLACSSDAAVIARSVSNTEDNLTTNVHQQSEQQTNSNTPPTSGSPPTQCPTPGSVATNDTVVLQHLKQVRLATIRTRILARFGLSESPKNSEPRNLTDLDEQSLATYYQFLSSTSPGQGRSGGEGGKEDELCSRVRGEKSDFYAKELRLHFPSSFRPIVPSVEVFEWGSLYKSDRRNRRYADGKGEEDVGKLPEKENSKDDGNPSGGSSGGPISPNPDENLTTTPETADRFSDVQKKMLQEYIAPLVYKLTFSDVDWTYSTSSTLSSAELRLFKRKKILDNLQIKQDTNPTEKVEIFRVWNSTSQDGTEYRFITSQSIGTERDEFVAFDVTNAIRDWKSARNKSDVLSLEVLVRAPQSVASGLSFLPSIEFDVPGYGKGEHNAQLVVAVPSVEDVGVTQESIAQEESSNRQKRQTVEAIERNVCRNETNCCLREFTIDFHRDLNMTWILSPRSYQVNYCDGQCPDYWPSGTLNTMFLKNYRVNNPLSAPEPCCTAATTSSLTMVVVIDNRILYNHVPDMIVNSCVCR